MRIAGSTALVTGASRGIGRATALELARRGARIKATGRDAAALDDVARRTGGEWLAADLERPEEVDRLAEWADPVDLLVNNAGFGVTVPFQSLDPAAADALIRVNLLAPIRLARLLLPGMIERGAGHIVNVASVAGHVGVAGEAVYSATKAGLIALSESLRYEVRSLGIGVTVVSPGVVRTAFFDRAGHPYDRAFPRLIRPERAARAIARAVRQDRAQVFVPGWIAFPVWLHGAVPWLYRRGAARYG
jgi:short-subunit dehydrogenase